MIAVALDALTTPAIALILIKDQGILIRSQVYGFEDITRNPTAF